ncbi:MAG: site-2 protease family protein [Planctomycetota bacterium]
MFGTYTLGQIFGVTIRVHGLVVLMLGLLVALGALRGDPVVLPLGSLLLALVAHELGHALVARRLGVQVVDIVLWPLGGMARMGEVPEDPAVEAKIAAAGPLVNLALASLTLAALGAFFGDIALDLPDLARLQSPAAALQVFLAMNLLLGVGNLLPAFPMDGGRLLRDALVGSGRSWLAATELAVKIGRWLAFAMILFGIVNSFVFVIIGLFVLIEGARELFAVRIRHGAGLFGGARGPFGATGGAFDLGALFRGAAPPQAAAGDAREPQADGPRGPHAPAGDRPAPAAHGPSPGSHTAEDRPTGTGPGGGFTDEDIRRLEAYRGRLKRSGE